MSLRSFAGLVPNHEDLEAAVHRCNFHWSRTAVCHWRAHLRSVDYARQVDISADGINRKGACVLSCRECLDNLIGVGHILPDDGEASVPASIGREDEPTISVISNRVGAGSDRKRRDDITGLRIDHSHSEIVASGK